MRKELGTKQIAMCPQKKQSVKGTTRNWLMSSFIHHSGGLVSQEVASHHPATASSPLQKIASSPPQKIASSPLQKTGADHLQKIAFSPLHMIGVYCHHRTTGAVHPDSPPIYLLLRCWRRRRFAGLAWPGLFEWDIRSKWPHSSYQSPSARSLGWCNGRRRC